MGPALYLLWGLTGARGSLGQVRDAFIDALAAAGRVHVGFAPAVLLLSATVAYREHAILFALAGYGGGLLLGATRLWRALRPGASGTHAAAVLVPWFAASIVMGGRLVFQFVDRLSAPEGSGDRHVDASPGRQSPLRRRAHRARPARLAYVDELLKKPALAARAVEAESDLTARTRTYVKVLIACTATFGAALGFHRGGAQILYAAVKLPLVTLVTLAVVAPLLHLLNRALERPANMARDVSALVAALARGALVLAAETPLSGRRTRSEPGITA